ncbi:hypothetical protein GWI33_012914 [Rhynchophorus ferrugineus]|uniref:Uncharacterized protein n=1 Tax=Rhynchophorus ferrugineus TaxID=354439 RepID=A0A834I4R2_RHYFE|nr:hypothetical protein GWI33_012914 [Rhynchophorus ferrugineus]
MLMASDGRERKKRTQYRAVGLVENSAPYCMRFGVLNLALSSRIPGPSPRSDPDVTWLRTARGNPFGPGARSRIDFATMTGVKVLLVPEVDCYLYRSSPVSDIL